MEINPQPGKKTSSQSVVKVTKNKNIMVLKVFAIKGPYRMERKKRKGKPRRAQNVTLFKQNESSQCSSEMKLLVVMLSA